MARYGITLGYQTEKCSICKLQKEIRPITLFSPFKSGIVPEAGEAAIDLYLMGTGRKVQTAGSRVSRAIGSG